MSTIHGLAHMATTDHKLTRPEIIFDSDYFRSERADILFHLNNVHTHYS